MMTIETKTAVQPYCFTLPTVEQMIVETRAELDTLGGELLQKELDLATLQGELAAFERKYIRIVGTLQARLDEIEVQVTEALVLLYPDDHSIREDARRSRIYAHESAKAAGNSGGRDFRDAPRVHSLNLSERFRPSFDLKQYYRDIAKRIHPDLANDEEERAMRTKLMIEANIAFQEGDEARLKAILLSWENNFQNMGGEDADTILNRLKLNIAHIHSRLVVIDGEYQRLVASDLNHIKVQVEKAETQGVDLLWAMAERLRAKIGRNEQRLKDLQRQRGQA
jgi:hypothetical protein